MSDTWWVNPEQLDEDQKKIVKLPSDGSYLVQGPPGSGKTNLLLLRANYISLVEKPNIMILTFTRTLKEFIAMGGEKYSFPVTRIKTHTAWSQEFLRRHGVTPNDNPNFPERRLNLCRQIQEVIASQKLQDEYDAILLDEAQDYFPQEIENFHILSEAIFAVADSRQKIYQSDSPLAILEGIVDDSVTLKYHYRNGRKICRLAEEIFKNSEDPYFMSSTSQYNESEKPSTVDRVECINFEDQCDRIIKALLVQIKAYPDELLGVLCPTNEDLDRVWGRISRSEVGDYAVKQSSSSGYEGFSNKTRVCVSTIHSAKGLEFRTVHMPCMENLWGGKLEINICFTAITRAKTSLAIYHVQPVHGYIEKAVLKVNANPLKPLVDPGFDQIFGR